MMRRFNPNLMPMTDLTFLEPYSLQDDRPFRGREEEIRLLASLIAEHRHVVLFGPPGAGKTSLVQAGLTPYFASRMPVYNLWADGEQVYLVHSPRGCEDSTLRSWNEFATGAGLLVLDQAEWMLDQSPAAVREFATGLAALLHERPSLKVLWVVREHELYRLDLLSAWFPAILNARFRLRHLTRRQARVAMEGLMERDGCRCEEALLTTLISDLGPTEIAPARLQVVYHALRAASRGKRSALTLADYHELGGAWGILEGYLDQVLTDLPDEEDHDLARALLKEMIGPGDPISAWRLRPIHLAEVERVMGGDRKRLERLLDFWQKCGVVRRLPDRERATLSGSFLIYRVSEWVQEDRWATKDVRDLLRRSLVDHWRTGRLLEKPALGRLWRNRARMRFSDEEMTLILRSSLARGYQWRLWVEYAAGAGVLIWNIIREALTSDDPHSRSSAVRALSGMQGDRVIALLEAALTDPYPNVRGLARAALAQSGAPEAIAALRRHPPPDMVLIPAGPFIMGSDEESDERPPHRVYLDAFYIDRYPVTNAEYAKFVRDTGHPPPPHWEPYGGTYPPGKGNHPVAYVCWFDARDYATWAGKRLPTEAEWEKAARGTDGRRYPWGDRFDSDYCNTDESEYWDTTPVDAFSPFGDSPYGVADMAGNVWEWVADWYDRDYYQRSPARNPRGPETGRTKVLRGGAWDFGARQARCSARNHEYPGPRHGLIGFRCAADPLPGEAD